MTWFNEPVVFTSLTIQFRVFKISGEKGNGEIQKAEGAMPKRVSRSQFKNASLAAWHARCEVQSEMFGMSKFVKVAK